MSQEENLSGDKKFSSFVDINLDNNIQLDINDEELDPRERASLTEFEVQSIQFTYIILYIDTPLIDLKQSFNCYLGLYLDFSNISIENC